MPPPEILILCVVQLYLPPDICLNKDFLKDVLAERKQLFRLEQVKFVTVPLYDELSLKNLGPQMENDAQFTSFFPDNMPRGRSIDRSYFFNVLHTLYPEYT